MPAAYTHLVFAEDVKNNMNRQIASLPMYWNGAQGPDMLFFSHMGVMPGTLHKLGNLMHSERVPQVLSFLQKHCQADPELYSYYQGFISHYGLDCRAHELIVSAAAYQNEVTGYPYGTMHVRMESEIDTYMLSQGGRRSLKEIWQEMKLTDRQKEKLGDLYTELFHEVYGLEVPMKKFSGAFTEMNLWSKVSRPRPIGQTAMIGGEFFIASPKNIHRMIHQGSTDWPILNSSHKAYPCWYDKNRTISMSFDELYEEGKKIALYLLETGDLSQLHYTFMGRPLQPAVPVSEAAVSILHV